MCRHRFGVLNDLLLQLRSEGVEDVHIVGLNGIEYAGRDVSGMIDGRVLPWVQDTAEQHVWESWKVFIRDLFVLDRDGDVVEVVNLTSFNPDPSVNEGENYRAIRDLLLNAGDK